MNDNMEIEIKTDLSVMPSNIDFNFLDLKEMITNRISFYKDIAVTKDSLNQAKKDRAKLNLLKNAIEEERKKIKKKCLEPYNDFEKKCKELVSIVQIPIESIDNQIKEIDKKRIADRYEKLKEYYKTLVTDENNFFAFDTVLPEKWENATISEDKIKEEIKNKINKINDDLYSLGKQFYESENKIAILQKYKECGELGKALVYAAQLEYETKIEKEKNKNTKSNIVVNYDKYEKQKNNILHGKFEVECSEYDLRGLVEYMKSNGIKYKYIN